MSVSYSHSGSTGDIFSSLAVVRCLGAGKYYLKLNNMDRVAQMIGWPNAGRHSGRMTKDDYNFIAPLMEIQNFITKFEIWNGQPIDYELEKSVYHHQIPVWPRNFANQYAVAMGVDTVIHRRVLQIDPYIDVDKMQIVPGKPVCVARNPYYLDGIVDPSQVPEWINWIERDLIEQSFFVGLPEDHDWFENIMKIKIHYIPTVDALELARLIAGSKMMIANQSMPGTLAVGLGTTLWIETRKNTPLDNNEILYPYRSNITYF